MKHTKEETRFAFDYWIGRMSQFCKEYDDGDEYAALLISNALRILLKTKGHTHSLLNQLDLESTEFIDSRKNPEGVSFCTFDSGINGLSVSLNPAVKVYLLGIHFVNDSGAVKYQCSPILERNINERKSTFAEWYEQEVFDIGEFTLSRKGLIESIAEQDGGTHFDPELTEEAYDLLRRKGSFELIVNGQKVIFENNPAFASLRQIGYEVLKSFGADC